MATGPNIFSTTDYIGNTALALIMTDSTILKCIKIRHNNTFNNERGDSIRIPKSIYMQSGEGADLDAPAGFRNDIEQGSVRLTLNRHRHISFTISRRELAHNVREEYLRGYVETACETLLDDVETDIATTMYQNTYSLVNPLTPSVGPVTVGNVSDLDIFQDEMSIPSGYMKRKFIVSPRVSGNLGSALTTVFVTSIAKNAIQAAYVGEISGQSIMKSIRTPIHTNGLHAGAATPLINGAAQDVMLSAHLDEVSNQTLLTSGWTAGVSTITAGSSFTIDGVFRVLGKASKTPTSDLQTFVVLSDITADGAGEMAISISPAMIVSGPNRTVSAAPADLAPMNMVGVENEVLVQNMSMHENAVSIAFGKFSDPTSKAVNSSTKSYKGLNLTVSKTSTFSNMAEEYRLDILWGVLVQNPHFIVRYSGT